MSEQKSTGEWMEDALCRRLGLPTDIFFEGPTYDPITAMQVCRNCPVRSECLEYQLRYEVRGTAQTAGIFGGLTALQRNPLRKQLRKAMKEARKETLS